MAYLKQEEVKAKGKRAKNGKAATDRPEPLNVVVTGPDTPRHQSSAALQHDINYVSGLGGIEQSLDWIARGLENLRHINLSTDHDAQPVKLTLVISDDDEYDTLSRLVTAFERIADSVAKLAGLSRPRLEEWHEQDNYEPRYRDSACDGGAPGPAQSTLEKVWPGA